MIRFDRLEMRRPNGQCSSLSFPYLQQWPRAEAPLEQRRELVMQGEMSLHQVSASSNPNLSNATFGCSRPRGATTWQVRRVEQYLETHWDQPITIEILARATAASARSIFYHFRICRGQSPMSFLKQLRLQRAKEMLERTDLNRSVTDTAIACGFGNLGHFAGDYFRRYGEHPSDTLKRGKCEFVSRH